MLKKVVYLNLAVLMLIVLAASSPRGGDRVAGEILADGGEVVSGQERIAASASSDTWLVMLYQNADDEILEQDIFFDLNEAELVGSSEQVTIVSQIDRYDGAFKGDGDWTSARRYLVTQDDDLNTINSELIKDLGEVDSGNKDTLVDFGTWAIQSYPSDHYVLILSDHGAGWTGGWNDSSPVADSKFTTNDIDLAMALIMEKTGIDGFELVGFDACLMSHLEDLSAVAPYARYAVASEETEPSLGWAYAAFLQALEEDPGMDGAQLASIIVDAYISQDIRIVDDDARTDYLAAMGYEPGAFSQSEMEEGMSVDVTLTAIDLSKMILIDEALNELVIQLVAADQQKIAEARSYAQSFESVFGEKDPSPFIDLISFVDLAADNLADDNINEAADKLRDTVATAIVNEKHGVQKPGASGFAIFFPASGLVDITYEQYVNTVTRFSVATLWDDFLLHHYIGEKIDITSADLDLLKAQYGEGEAQVATFETVDVPALENIEAPGSGGVSLTPITLTANEIDQGDSTILSTTVSGKNIGYIYLYTEYCLEGENLCITVDTDYIMAEDVKEIGGVIYPDWGSDESFDLEVEWTPSVFYITNGEDTAFAGAEPVTFGKDPEDTIYRVWGTYVYTDSGQERSAVIYFNGLGVMQEIYGFMNEDGTGAPREILPNKGDQFIVEDEWFVYKGNGLEGEYEYKDGDTLTFGDSRFAIVYDDTITGDFAVGIVVENLDGQKVESFADVYVNE